jgi:hypothetical protein
LGTHEAPVRCVEYSHATGKIKKKTYAITIHQEIARFSHMIQFYHTITNLVQILTLHIPVVIMRAVFWSWFMNSQSACRGFMCVLQALNLSLSNHGGCVAYGISHSICYLLWSVPVLFCTSCHGL